MDKTENSLELILEWDDDLPLGIVISISMFILDEDWTSLLNERALVVIENDLFANYFIGTTMQYSSKRERSNIC